MKETLTDEGYIPHLEVVTAVGVILAPVKLQPDADGKIRIKTEGSEVTRRPAPMRRNGRLVFALPGGGELVA